MAEWEVALRPYQLGVADVPPAEGELEGTSP